MGVVYHLRSHVTAKAWNNYFPRFLFYFKIRLLFIEYRFKNKKRKNPSPAQAKSRKCVIELKPSSELWNHLEMWHLCGA